MLQDGFEILASGLALGCYSQWQEECCEAPCKSGEEHLGQIDKSRESISKDEAVQMELLKDGSFQDLEAN